MIKYISSPGIFTQEDVEMFVNAAAANGARLVYKVKISDKSNQVLEVEASSEEIEPIRYMLEEECMLVHDTFPNHLFE